MTVNNRFKKQVRARMKMTGETYTQAFNAVKKAVEESAKRYEESTNNESKEN